ncbi:ABC transporter substrate-binding protein [Paenibacillus glucanolyticus]|jgi:iron(III) transport system substrate-binding protein|uniref:extracellular solute-binding protein n=1 Tax=Paenibacillus TaxID=44249 RepID=UPI0003E28DF1|nr:MULTISPECIES: extracellular solute-binding protein [Paenibacillus]ANA78789.1 ABC transporter substrate-binding protein [Paenibacillus glucanolyticus]AVV57297.1 ABC transporter substrate-binding protein [Paenibacillus glucanolyticus]ETT35467.1 extracellular solute-binding protein [Paenibacillus sp. FSL R5-808]
MNKKTGFKYGMLFALTALMWLLSACAQSDGQQTVRSGETTVPIASGSGASGQSEVSSGNDKVEDTGETIYLYGNDFVDFIAPKFMEETGFKIEAVHYGGGEALAKIEAEQGNPQWDVLMMDGHGSVRNLADRDFLMTGWQPENLGNLSENGKAYVPEDFAYFPVGIHAAGVIAYNTDRVSPEKAPTTWEQFFKYDGPVGHADPAVAAPAYPLVSAFFEQWGVAEAEQKYAQRFEKGLHVYPKNGPVGKALLSGEIEVAALQEHNAYELKLAGEPIEVIWPEEGAPGSLRVVAISKQAKNPAAAKAFVEYMLKPETQQMLTALDSTDSFFTPLVEGVPARSEREPNGAFMLPSAKWASEHEVEIKTWFADQNVR